MKSKVISIITVFVFSILLWVFVSLSDEYSSQFSVPIVIKNLPENSKVSLVEPSRVNILIKGKGWQLLQFDFGKEKNYVIDLKKHSNVNTILTRNFLSNNNWLTTNTQVISLEPELIKIKTEKAFSKKAKIFPDIILSFKENYGLVSDVSCNPDSIQIFGPWSKTLLIEEIKTEKVKLTNVESSQNILAKLVKPNFINFNLDEVEVKFEVEKIVDKLFENVKIQKLNVPFNKDLILSPASISIVLKGGIQKLALMKSDDIKASIDYNQVIYDSLGVIEPKINLQKYFEVIDVLPNKIKYIIKQY